MKNLQRDTIIFLFGLAVLLATGRAIFFPKANEETVTIPENALHKISSINNSAAAWNPPAIIFVPPGHSQFYRRSNQYAYPEYYGDCSK
jgi:hypothetical protein